MAVSTEKSVFDLPVGDFNWGPRRRWRSILNALAPLLLATIGVLLIAVAMTRLWG